LKFDFISLFTTILTGTFFIFSLAPTKHRILRFEFTSLFTSKFKYSNPFKYSTEDLFYFSEIFWGIIYTHLPLKVKAVAVLAKLSWNH